MKWLSGVILIFLLVACKDSQTLPKLGDDAVILAFGDSLTYGTGASQGHDYPNILAQLSKRIVINAGIPGEVTEDGLKRLPALLDEHQPQLLILIHGGNDIVKKLPQQATLTNLTAMIGLAGSRHVPVIMLGVPNPALFLMESAEVYQEIAKNKQVIIDLEILPNILGDNDLKSDMIHPNDEGYQRMAARLQEMLVSAGALADN